MQNRPTKGPARYTDQVGADHSTAPAPSFHALLAQQLQPVWEYKLAGRDSARVLFPAGATRDEVLNDLERRFPGRAVQYLKPAGGGDAR